MRDRVKILGFALAVLTAWAVPSPAQEGIEYVAGRPAAARQVLVKFRSTAPPSLAKLGKTYNLDLARAIGSTGAYLLRSRSRSASALLKSLRARRDVLYAEPDHLLYAAALPNDPRFAEQWGLQNVGQSIMGSTGTFGADIGAVSAWDVTTGGAGGPVVAVLDTGVDTTHADLGPNLWMAPAAFSVRIGSRTITCPQGSRGYDAIRNTCDPMDDNGHGTMIAGIIGAVGNNGEGVSGVNQTARVLAVKFLNSRGAGTTSNFIDALDFLIQLKQMGVADVRVVVNSWGGNGNSKAMMDAVSRTLENDMLFVSAAGNLAQNNDVNPFYPASFSFPNVLSVTATDHRDQMMSSANFGANSVHVGAPGAFILSTIPGGNYDYSSGTSMAAAYAGGAATLMLAACPDLNALDARSILVQSAQPTAALAGKTISGGRVRADHAIEECTAPAFKLSATPASVTITQGATANFTVQITPTGGFAGSVLLGVSGGHPEAIFSYLTGVVTPPASDTLTIENTLNIPPGTYLFTLTGTAGDVVRTTPVWVVVTRTNSKQLQPGN